MTSVSVGTFFAVNVHDRASPGVQSSQRKDCGFNLCGSGGGVETDKRVAERGTGIGALDDHFFVGDVSQLLLGKRNGAWRRRERIELAEAGCESRQRNILLPAVVGGVSGVLFE